ncbi:MAG: DNA primase [Rhodospirillales bacterium]|nr:DNA primase [Rhodospirillales bacterium]
MSIPPRFLDEIRGRLTLSDIIGRRVNVQRAGREFKACCPFHHEKTPSFTINDDKQFYHCFGCGAHGDVIGFVMQHDNLSFPDAVEMLAAEAGLQVPKPDPKAIEKAQKAKDLHDLMDEATAWMQAQVNDPVNKDVHEYLESRGMNEDIRAAFRIGYAPADGQALRKVLADKGFSDVQMREVGLLKDSSRSGQPYIFFRDRVMFPVCDRRGRVVAFGGRILPEAIRPQKDANFKPPKYINTADTPLFDKGRMLYAESLARQAAREGHTLIVTEGYMDVIACNKFGFKGAIAPMGTALTEEQILSLWSMMVDENKIPILCFDGDNAGRSAASRACERILPLLKPGKSARFAFLPEGEDPDSLLRNAGPQGFKAALASALSLFDFLWATHTAGRDLETPEARAGLSKTLHGEVSKIADPEVQKHYRELVRTRISEKFFTPRQNKNRQARPAGDTPKLKSAMRLRPVLNRKNALSQRILLACVLNNPQIYHRIEEEFGRFHIDAPGLDRLRQQIVHALIEDDTLDFQALQGHLKLLGFEQEMHDILNESVYVHAAFARRMASDSPDEPQIVENWLTLYAELCGHGENRQVRAQWQEAFATSNEEQEDRLRDLVRIRGSE